jgi:hypothetical protein
MGKLPLNDPRWLAMKAAIDLREQQTADVGLALRDIEQAMASGKLRSMRRDLAGGEAELVAAVFWETHFVGYLTPLSVIICRQTDSDRYKTDEYGNLAAERLDGWAFYIWKPDLEKYWLTTKLEEELDEPKPGWQVARVKELLPIVYPDGVPPEATNKEVQSRLVSECKKRGWKLPSEDTIARARRSR